jgi:hypothetical protein
MREQIGIEALDVVSDFKSRGFVPEPSAMIEQRKKGLAYLKQLWKDICPLPCKNHYKAA